METVLVTSGPALEGGAGLATGRRPSAVAWGAILAGAVAAIAVSIILLTLGAGLGFSAVSPWSGVGATAKAIGIGAIVWLIIVQWLSAGLGGYITGRLRLRWNHFSRDEVYFRDTAHGFLSWAAALAIVAVISAAMAAGLVGSAVQGAATGAAQNGSLQDASTAYYVDSLYRADKPAATGTAEEVRGETAIILSRNLGAQVNPADRAYLAKLVAARAGISEEEAGKRIDETIVKAKQAADAARKAAATFAIATALSLMIGAFIAAVAGGIGGRSRDDD